MSMGSRVAFIVAGIVVASQAVAQDVTNGDPAEGRLTFDSLCAACHGEGASGDGAMADVLTVAPPDLTQLTLDNGGSFPLARVVRQIDGRDQTIAHAGVMPIFGRFFEGEDTALRTESGQPILTSRAIADLAAYLASIQE